MAKGNSIRKGNMLAAERRREIFNWALEHGFVNVATLAEALGVGQNTVRRDLDILHRQGKLVRSHGGAVIKDTVGDRPPYSQTRHEHAKEKQWIGEAALEFVPESGSIFLGPGTTVYSLATGLPDNCQLHAVTNSPEIALHLASRTAMTIDLAGGRLRNDSFASSFSLSRHILDVMYWDVTFMGISAIDPERGISSVDMDAADLERKFIEHGGKAIVLCDSSKLGRFSYVNVGPVDLIDVLITDVGASPEMVNAITDQGVEVVLAGPSMPANN